MAKTSKKTPPKQAAPTKKPAVRKPAPTPKPAAKVAAPTVKQQAKPRDPRLPAAGATIEKKYKGKVLKVDVRERDFEFDGRDWSSLTAIAMAVTGAKSINGPLFFGIAKRAPKATGEAK